MNEETVTIAFYEEKYKSKLVIGKLTIFLTKKLNWFQRKMYKVFFNITATNIDTED